MRPAIARALYRAVPLLAVLLGLAGCKERPADPGPSPAQLQAFGIERAPGAPAPALELVAMDGSRFSLAGARGQIVFVNFWATWCPPCRDEMPSMLALGRELESRYPGKFRMVAVSVDEGWDQVREFFGAPPYLGQTTGMTVALDREQTATTAYYCAARGTCPKSYLFPESYIVDKSGRLVAYVVGPRNWASPVARAFLEQLIRSEPLGAPSGG
jgi:thiol-disulfide isomerase/thioredoxin